MKYDILNNINYRLQTNRTESQSERIIDTRPMNESDNFIDYMNTNDIQSDIVDTNGVKILREQKERDERDAYMKRQSEKQKSYERESPIETKQYNQDGYNFDINIIRS